MVDFARVKIKMEHIDRTSQGVQVLCYATAGLVLLYVLAGVFYSEYMDLQGNVLALKAQTTQSSETTQSPPTEENGESQKVSEKFLSSSKLFGELSPPDLAPTPKKKATPKKASDDTLSLIGTFVSLNNNSYAIVENKKKRAQDVFLVGEDVFGIATLRSIENLSVTILRDGKEEKLVMEEGVSGGGTTSAPPGVESETKVVDNADIEDALNNLPVLLTQARTVPYFSNGKRDGLRLFAIRSGSFFEKIGLKNGDILKEINGNDLNDQSKALELFQKLKSERRLSVKLVRNRKEKLINYEIR